MKKKCPVCGKEYRMIKSDRDAGKTEYYHVIDVDTNKAFYNWSVCTENWDHCPTPTITIPVIRMGTITVISTSLNGLPLFKKEN